jgi:hypothetical protein
MRRFGEYTPKWQLREMLGNSILSDPVSSCTGASMSHGWHMNRGVGRRGDWFATVNGEEAPCAWNWSLTGMHYCDPGAEPGTGKWVKYIEAIQHGGKVALTDKKEGAGKWERDGYIGLFEVANIKTTEHTLEFDLTRRHLPT